MSDDSCTDTLSGAIGWLVLLWAIVVLTIRKQINKIADKALNQLQMFLTFFI